MSIINIDAVIFLVFLAVNLVFGLRFSQGISTIREYAVGDRNFSTATIVATIVATWVSGEFFFTNIAETYTHGLHFIWITVLGDFLCLLIIGMFFAPRMGEFLGKLSIAEAMGGLYGERVRIITAIAGFIGTAGLIAIQLKMGGMVFEYAFNLPSIYGIILAALIVVIYSSLGGIKSVTFTDVIQFFTFAVVIPIIAYALLTSIENVDIITNTLTFNPKFNYKEVFDFSNPESLHHLFLAFFFIIPAFNPAIFQRVAMAKNVKQVRESFIIAAIVCFVFAAIVVWIGVLTLSIDSSLNPNDTVKYIISHSYVGVKGLILVGIMAMVMSTVDSYINATSILVVHDFCKPLKIKLFDNELTNARVMSAIIGIVSLLVSMREESLLELLVFTFSLYMPIITVPFIMSVLGFRSTEKSVLIAMLAGFATIITWDYILKIENINSVPCGLLANLIALMASHYLLKQPGGWVGIKDTAPLKAARWEREQRIRKLQADIRNFNFLDACQRNCPKGDGLISILGLFVMVTIFSSTHTLPKEYQIQHAYFLDVLYPLTLCTSSVLISYPLWLQSWRETRLIGLCWNIIMFAVLICFSFLMVLISNFSEIQLMVFMINIIVLSSLISWRWALLTITTGIAITAFVYETYIHIELQGTPMSSQFKIVYLLMLIISTLITFLKPKQDYQELTEDQKQHLEMMMKDRELELEKLQDLKYEFLRNLQHEVNTPLTGITSLGPALLDSFDQLPPDQLKKYVETMVASSERYSSLAKNLLNLSNLSSLSYKLNKTKVLLSELVRDRLTYCRRLYQGNKPLEFITHITPDIALECDQHYLTSAFDNLIINAINYSKEGTITVKLSKDDSHVVFQIIDEGIGIPKKELYDIL